MDAATVDRALVLALLGVAAALLVVVAVLSPRIVGALTVFTLGLPLFVDMTAGRPTLARLPGGGGGELDTGIHVGVGLILAGAIAGTSRSRPRLPGARLVGWLGLVLTGSVIVGVLSGAGWLGVVFYAQTIIPLLAWFALARSGVTPRTARRAVLPAVTLSLLMVTGAALVTTGSLAGSLEQVERITAVIPQYRNYFPFVVTCGVAFAVAGWSRHRRWSLLLLGCTLLALPLMWSRTGLAMMCLAAAVAFFARPAATTKATRVLLGSVVAVAGGFLVMNAVSGGVLGERTLVGDAAERSGGRRLVYASEATDRLIASPLFGDAFIPHSERLAGGFVADFARLFPAHNQYLDMGLRGGVVALALMVALLVSFGRRAHRLARTSPDAEVATFHAALLAIIVAVAVGNVAQLFMIQPWTGGLLFALLGVSSASIDPDRDGSGDQAERPELGQAIRRTTSREPA